MAKDEEIDSLLQKITTEIETVKLHVSDAKYNLSVDNYSEALSHLKQAEKTSTCSYCKNKLSEAIFDIEYNRNICNINSKNCTPNKNEILRKIDDFYNKLPKVEDIKKDKAINNTQPLNFDVIGGISKTFDDMSKSFGKMFESMFKW